MLIAETALAILKQQQIGGKTTEVSIDILKIIAAAKAAYELASA
jgi:hypothetical protein